MVTPASSTHFFGRSNLIQNRTAEENYYTEEIVSLKITNTSRRDLQHIYSAKVKKIWPYTLVVNYVAKRLRESDKEVKNIILFLRNFLLKNSRSPEKMSKDKEFLKLAKEYKIIFWKRFEQFLDFAKIYHLQKIKKFLESS